MRLRVACCNQAACVKSRLAYENTELTAQTNSPAHTHTTLAPDARSQSINNKHHFAGFYSNLVPGYLYLVVLMIYYYLQVLL